MAVPEKSIRYIFFAALVGLITPLPAQSTDPGMPVFPDKISPEIPYRFDIEVGPRLEKRIMEVSGQKLELYGCAIALNSYPLDVKSCKTRGNTTLHFRRKSFSISLGEAADFEHEPVKRLAVNNLAMDRNKWRNRLAFITMKKMGIFPLKNNFAEVRINGKTQGIYLAIQKPEDYVRSLHSPLLLRREYDGVLTEEYAKGKEARWQLKRFRKGQKLMARLSGRALYDSLDQIVELDQYNQWLAFNTWLRNGDYTDELFFYVHPKTGKFNIIPWDYDDLFKPEPHEGMQKRNQAIGNRLLFSGEADFDVVISRDDYLYLAYLQQFRNVLDALDQDVLRAVFEQVYRELYPFFTDPDINAQSAYDYGGGTSINALKKDLMEHYRQMLVFRQVLLGKIADEIKSLEH